MGDTQTTHGFVPVNQATGKAVDLSMQTLWLTGQVLGVGARLWVRHEFESQESKPVEVIYSFVLPRDASLRRFRLSGTDFSVDSELRPTEEAHKIYEAGIQAGSFSGAIFNLLAPSTVTATSFPKGLAMDANNSTATRVA